MINQQKQVQQETAVVVNYVSPSLPIQFVHVSMTPFESKTI